MVFTFSVPEPERAPRGHEKVGALPGRAEAPWSVAASRRWDEKRQAFGCPLPGLRSNMALKGAPDGVPGLTVRPDRWHSRRGRTVARGGDRD